jgi:membrane protein YdbS with pleckstrin-like domain
MPHDDFAVEPVTGLPEKPPSGEVILWQGKPDPLVLAKEALNLWWIAGYFGLLAAWRVGVSSVDMGLLPALPLALPFLILGLITCGILLLIAWVQAKVTVYTITTERVAMRVGAALTITLNLPFSRIAAADLDLRRSGTGTIAFRTAGETRLSYLVLWPHVRPWRIRHAQPALRCIPEARKVADLISDAVETRIEKPEIGFRTGPADPVPAE